MIDDVMQIIGAGQCGTRIGMEFEKLGINTLYINSDELDVRGTLISPSRMLLLETTGTGGSPTKGKEMLEKNWDSFTEFMSKNIDRSKMIFVIAGGGGGTGGGIITPLIEYLNSIGVKVGLLFTLPPKMLGILASDNALKTLKLLKDQKVNLFLLADNEFLINRVGLSNVWWEKVNQYIVSEVTSSFELLRPGKLTQSGIGSIDKGEIMRILQYGNGMTDMRTLYFDSEDLEIEDKELTRKLFEATLVEGYQYKTTLAYLVGIDVPKKKNYTNDAKRIFDLVKKVSGSAISRVGMFVDPMLSDAMRVTMINAGLKLPRILQSRVNNLKRDEQRFVEKKNKEDVLDISELEEGILDDEFDI